MENDGQVDHGLQSGGGNKANLLNEAHIKACVARFDSGAYSRLQFLRAVSHYVGAHTESLRPDEEEGSSDDGEESDNATTTTANSFTASSVP